MARIAQQVLSKSNVKYREKEMRVWSKREKEWTFGWWHPTKDMITFGWSRVNYHITQIFKNPDQFGITERELRKAVDQWISEHKEKFAEVKEKMFKPDLDDYQNIVRLVKDGYFDNIPAATALATEKGWIFFSITRDFASFGSTRKDNIKAVIRELLSARKIGTIDVILFNKNDPDDMLANNPKELSGMRNIENFLNS